MSARRAEAVTPSGSRMWILPASQVKPVTKTWPGFETLVIPGKCCPGCGHILEDPRAGAIMKVDTMREMPNIADPLFKKRELAAKGTAMKRWKRTVAGRAWARHNAKPTKANYLAYKAAQEAQNKRDRTARARAKGGAK